MIPTLTVTDEITARIVLVALSGQWDVQMRGADRTDDRHVFALLLSAAVQAHAYGIDYTRHLDSPMIEIVDREIEHAERIAADHAVLFDAVNGDCDNPITGAQYII